jgi:DNA-binding transcriptional LysR family regulator
MGVIPFSQLQDFLAVARAGNFSGAARQLGVSRSAVSQAVRQLEEQLRVVLVQRTTRSVALTEAGRRLDREEVEHHPEQQGRQAARRARVADLQHASQRRRLPGRAPSEREARGTVPTR